MASLTHVCMWTDKGWKRISAEEASRLASRGTVSAKSGLFMCELCGQYVTLTDSSVQTRHFRHSAHEESKNCPERLFGPNHSFSFNSQEHELPIRITNINSSTFGFEVGLVRVPSDLLNQDLRIEIQPDGVPCEKYVYMSERLNSDHLTYLSIGEKPHKKYKLQLQNGNKMLNVFWPEVIKGIDPKGTIFEKDTGRKLVLDSDVVVNKEYYLLKRDTLNRGSDTNIKIQKICKKKWGKQIWNLYLVQALTFNEKAARFFLSFHCRLTEIPVSLSPVWPLYIEEEYLIKHSQNTIYLAAKGNIERVTAFPDATATIRNLSHSSHIKSENSSKIYEIDCSGRQQLVSSGRNQVLVYTYFWKEPLEQIGFTPKISVKDLNGSEVGSGETDSLPKKNLLQFESPLDGEITIIKKERIIRKYKLYADTLLELDEISYGTRIQVLIGLDIVWQITFKKPKSLQENHEEFILNRLSNTPGPYIPTPGSLRNIIGGLDCYPLIRQWIWHCIKSGVIKEQSYRKLQEFYRNVRKN